MNGICKVVGCGMPIGPGRFKYCTTHGRASGQRGSMDLQARYVYLKARSDFDDAPDPTCDHFSDKVIVMNGHDYEPHRLAIRLLQTRFGG